MTAHNIKKTFWYIIILGIYLIRLILILWMEEVVCFTLFGRDVLSVMPAQVEADGSPGVDPDARS
jgi:hypothetical protein